jgi:phosphotransferase system enzyme I (PtsI)
MDATAAELERLASLQGTAGKIFAAHREILLDEAILEEITECMVKWRYAPEYAVYKSYNQFMKLLAGSGDELVSERQSDLRDVRNRLIRALRDEREDGLADLPGPVILVARDLLPSDTAAMDRRHVLAIVTEQGGETSHTAILANSFSIPALAGVAVGAIRTGMELGVDAFEGLVHCAPAPEIAQGLLQKKLAFAAQSSRYRVAAHEKTKTSDGVPVEIGLNIEAPTGHGACDFVGLLRTEFLYMDRSCLPTEEEQMSAYRQAIELAGDLTLRTLDIGGDKTLPYLGLPKEANPFLGRRALRLCFANPSLLYTQLRAALRAAVYGKLKIMVPMAGGLEDLRAARQVLESVRRGLREEGLPFRENVPFGVMIEVPALAAIADLVAEEADFASIGTNDLAQYLCAADRMNTDVSEYFRALSPAMARVLGFIIEAFDKQSKPVSVCGEMAGQAAGAILLLGLGLRKFSVSESKVGRIKDLLARASEKSARALANRARDCRTEKEVATMLLDYIRQIGGEV